MTRRKARVPAGRELGFLREHRQRYVEEWSNDSAAFDLQGLYAWMIGPLAGFGVVLEVGCGDGRSTLAVVRQGHKVIGVDENPYSLERTRQRLRAEGITCEIVRRGTQTGTKSNYEMEYVT